MVAVERIKEKISPAAAAQIRWVRFRSLIHLDF
jgi:hypothetical protein